jgi:hypothetical protein
MGNGQEHSFLRPGFLRKLFHRNTPVNAHLFEVVGALPAMGERFFGVIAMVCRWPQNPLDWVCLIGGTLVCCALTVWLGGFL